MELVEDKFIQTEVGLIPNDWELKSYSQVFTFLTTATYSRADLSTNDEVKYIHYGDIHTKWNYYLNIENNELPSISNEKVKKYPFLQEGDVIMADASEDYIGVGKSVEVINLGNVRAISGLHTFLLRDKNKIFVDGLRAYIHSNLIVKKQFDELATGMKVYSVSKYNLKKVLIPIPKIPEQTRIATALSDTDSYIASLEKLIAKKRLIKQGAMQQLLAFKPHWIVKQLGDIASIKDGTHQTPKYFENGVPFYSVETVTANDFTNTKFISDEEHHFLTRNYRIEKGDILMTRIGSIGECKYIDWEPNASFYVSLALLKIKKEFNAEFICHYSQTDDFKKEIELNSLQHAIPKKINLGQISFIKITIPASYSEQAKISNILSDMDSSIAVLVNKLSKARQLKQGMMQLLLTGKIRLV